MTIPEPLPGEDIAAEQPVDSPPLDAGSVREFAQLVRAETGVVLSDQEAWDRATELIALVRMLLRPDAEDPESQSDVEFKRRPAAYLDDPHQKR